jgi:hypothetical protein
MASSVENSAWLEWMSRLMGGASRQTYASTLPPDRFYCLLDDLPLHLIPRRAVEVPNVQKGLMPLFLNPECVLCRQGQLPDEVANQTELLSGFALQGTIAWVRNPAMSTLLPFLLGPEMEAALQSLRPNVPVPSTVPRDFVNLLSAADILLPECRIGQHDHDRNETLARSGTLFRERGYAPLGNLIHPFHVAALRRYYRHLIRTGQIRLGDGQSPRRYVAYNEPVARFFHRQITSTLSAVAGESLKPSYVYFASYLSGAELKKHTDRQQCEYSVTLCLDFCPEPVLETPWPIRLDTPNSTVTVYQALGDGLAYRGTRLPHYRDVLGEGRTSTSIFFHYVALDFTGSLD